MRKGGLSVGKKVVRSQDLGISASCKHNQTIENGKKLASACFMPCAQIDKPTKVVNEYSLLHLVTASTVVGKFTICIIISQMHVQHMCSTEL